MYAVWLVPSNKDRKILQKIISDLADKYKSPVFIPHITTYGLVDIALGKLEDFVCNSIQGIKSFDVYTNNIDYSDNIWKTLFINIQMNYELEKIFQNLQKQLDNISHYDYLPHVSLIYKKMKDDEKKSLVDNLQIPKKFHIDKIAIQEFSEDVTNWKLVRVINF
ncbi:MAG: hypothetical protein DWQ18_00015 [Crenarchaeota archaeon]|nr:MAG: hypothetical protein DWQ17_05200 [Thermoproteota archaeon]RDJ34379.1 MAG: hypothetical protein DWQ18_00015 [Thermoproteota archaeon]RDJ34716.1 MAG: hypothetical protein DWQ19_13130 [Thermoproteota archaeon]RDJ38682.1 MAG: hypothetical protein DWQ13_04805 [Thermoproteota archaeon]